MMVLDATDGKKSEAMIVEVLNADALILTPNQRAKLQSAFGVYMRSVIMLERVEAATSSRVWSVASMAFAAMLLVFLAVPAPIILSMVVGAEVLGVVIGKATRRAVVKEINETQRRLYTEIKVLQDTSIVKSTAAPTSQKMIN